MNEIRETISMCIDIRNSTNFHKNFDDLEKPVKIISDFIEEVYKVAGNGVNDKFLYAGDGIIFIHPLNDNEKNNKHYKIFKKFLNAANEIEKIIKKYEKANSNFKAGIGIDFGKSIQVPIKNIPDSEGRTPLYAGTPISRSTKICKSLPLIWKGKNRITGLNEEFYMKLDKNEKKKYKLTSSKKKAMKHD